MFIAIGQNEDLLKGPALIDPSNKSMMFSSQVCFHFLFCIIVVSKIIYQPTLAFQARTCFVLQLRDSSVATRTRYGRLVLSQGRTDSFKDDDDDNEDDTGWGTAKLSNNNDEYARVEPNANSNQSTRKEGPDLFIPIFALVSIAGFAGLYGYEMIRLYLRGEFYLPF